MKFSVRVFTTKSTTGALCLLWFIFLTRGFFYSAILPIWEGYDEPYHFSAVEYVVATHKLPSFTTPINKEVEASLHVLPLPWMLRLHAIQKPLYTEDDFWRLQPSERDILKKRFHDLPAEWGNEPSSVQLFNYEAQQPPLYYVLCSFLMSRFGNSDLASRVFLLRFTGIALASFVVPIGFLVAKRITGSPTTALAMVGLLVVMPELFVSISRVSNEIPAIVLYTVLLYFAIRVVEGPSQFSKLPVVGIIIALGLLTKAYFIAAVPALVVTLYWCSTHWPKERKRLFVCSAVTAIPILAIGGLWYWHIHATTGTWSGLHRDITVHSTGRGLIAQIPHVNWLGGFVSIVLSHIWFGAWSFLKVPKLFYLVFGSVFLLACLGLMRIVLRYWRSQRPLPAGEGYLVVLLAFYGFFCMGLVYDILLTFVSLGVSSSTGWYMYCLVVAEVVLLYYGLIAIVPKRVSDWSLPVLTTGFILLDAYGLYLLLIPYYTGLIYHFDSSDRMSTITIGGLVQFGFGNIARRLLINKPSGLTAITLFVLWFLSIAGSIWVAVMAWSLARPNRSCLDVPLGEG